MRTEISVSDKASKAGLTMVNFEGRVEARKGNKVIAFHTDPAKALAKALERLEEDRLRKLDPLPEDREPVLKIKKKRTKEAAPAPIVLPPPPAIVIKGSIVKSQYRAKYKANNFSCGDLISDELRAFIAVLKDGRMLVDLVRLRQVADDNAIWKATYSNLNTGQQRMTIGNRLRAKYEEGLEIIIGGAPFVKVFD